MTSKETFDAYMKLAEFGAGRWDARRQYEWKITFGLWALLALAISSFRVSTLPGWLGIAIVIGYAVGWQRNIFLANNADKALSDAYRRHAQKTLPDSFSPPSGGWRVSEAVNKVWWLKRSIGFLVDWAAMFQVLVTAVLVVLVYEICQTQGGPMLGATWLDWIAGAQANGPN